MNGNMDEVKRDHMVNVNNKDRLGMTALHYAVRNKRVDIVRLLLSHNANPNARDANGRDPLSYAAINGNIQIVELLLSHGTA